MAQPETQAGSPHRDGHARTRPASRDHGARLRHLAMLDRLRGPALPMSAAGLALLAWPASVAGLLPTATALRLAVACLLAGAMHVGFAELVDERTSGSTAATLVAFAALWAFVFWTPFSDQVEPGPPVFAGELALHGAPLQVPLESGAGRYRLIVEGRLPSGDRASHAAHYRIDAGEGASTHVLEGDFTDRWDQRRSGRRGVSTVHVSHTERAHDVTSQGSTLALSLQSLTPGASDAVGVKLYRDAVSTPLFVGLGTALTVAALLIDSWRSVAPDELLLTTLTLGSLLAVASFRRYAPPHPGFGDVAFNGAIGAIAGTIGSRILSRLVRVARSRRAAAR